MDGPVVRDDDSQGGGGDSASRATTDDIVVGEPSKGLLSSDSSRMIPLLSTEDTLVPECRRVTRNSSFGRSEWELKGRGDMESVAEPG